MDGCSIYLMCIKPSSDLCLICTTKYRTQSESIFDMYHLQLMFTCEISRHQGIVENCRCKYNKIQIPPCSLFYMLSHIIQCPSYMLSHIIQCPSYMFPILSILHVPHIYPAHFPLSCILPDLGRSISRLYSRTHVEGTTTTCLSLKLASS